MTGRRQDPVDVICLWCGETFKSFSLGLPRKYCTRSHKSLFFQKHKAKPVDPEKRHNQYKEWYQKRKEKHIDYVKRYYQQNREKILAQKKAYRTNNQSKRQASMKNWYAKNPGYIGRRNRGMVQNLTDGYVKVILKNIGITEPSPEVITLKRKSVKAQRLVKQIKHKLNQWQQ